MRALFTVILFWWLTSSVNGADFVVVDKTTPADSAFVVVNKTKQASPQRAVGTREYWNGFGWVQWSGTGWQKVEGMPEVSSPRPFVQEPYTPATTVPLAGSNPRRVEIPGSFAEPTQTAPTIMLVPSAGPHGGTRYNCPPSG